ncbi:class I SAM-dependent methyltransferase [Priestia abyssalis]|uniref:class I SAM-dependent methyltransferase n=1 Tax=Priestia abyssalis TaxID=1221450 RepID=UPI0009953625|nr:class I SAM-dependent methyltransferase [Priestia abyssalis]
MKLERILPFARTLLQKAVNEGDIAVDATIGNGHDTVLLAELVGETGHVYGFDIQQQALENTRQKLKEKQLDDRVTLFHKSHSHLREVLPPTPSQQVTAAIFNLGYLPGGDKNIVTKADSTIEAINQMINVMAPEGIIVLVIYHGHPEGALERDQLLQYVTGLDQQKVHVLQYKFMNQQNNPPFIIAIEKRA